MKLLHKTKPRTGRHAEKNGDYLLSPQLSNHIVNPNEKVSLKIYITGYGEICSSKLSVSYPEDLINYNDSSLFKDFIIKDLDLKYGAIEQKLESCGFSLDLGTGGLNLHSWEAGTRTFFFDVNDNPTPRVATELELGRAPFELSIKINKKAKAGIYNIYVYLTYYNGHEWKGDRVEIPITVTSIYQRNEASITYVAFGFAFISVITAITDTVLSFLRN